MLFGGSAALKVYSNRNESLILPGLPRLISSREIPQTARIR